MNRSDVVSMAYAIIDMHEEIQELRRENARLQGIEKERDEMVMSNIRHSESMLGGILKLVLVPGVTEAIAANAAQED